MASTFRAQVVAQPKTVDVGRDYLTNVLHYASATTAASLVGDALLAAFTASGRPYQGMANVWVKMYDLANPLHSPPVYTAHYAGSGLTAMGPRQVALCISFYSGLNVRGQRGRIYIGGWGAGAMTEYASSTILTTMRNVALDLRNPGGADIVHQIRHPKAGTFSNVSNYFVNDRWDTMRSRLPKESTRVTVP